MYLFVLKAFPCIFVLSTHRNEDTFVHILKYVEEKWELRPIITWIDYEKSLRSAFFKIHPMANTKGHWYQFMLAVRRKCKTLQNFFDFLWGNTEAAVLYHQFLCLPFMPKEHIKESFSYLKQKASVYEGFVELITYFEKVWIFREGQDNISIVWNSFGKPYTHNYNSELKAKFKQLKGKCSLFYLIQLWCEEEAIGKQYKESTAQDITKINTSRQTHLIRKERIRIEATKNVPEFFQRLTFCDNTGAIKGMENYEIDDENDFDTDDDEEYEEVTRNARNVANDSVANEHFSVASNICVICLHNSVNTLIEPCNHARFCQECIQTLITTYYNNNADVPAKCPVCRTAITANRTIFL